MELRVLKGRIPSPATLLRKAGYAYFIDPVTKEDSYVLRLTGDYYPRFHIYVKETSEEYIINLHLDQKKPSYEGGPKHAGEYTGATVEREIGRLERWVGFFDKGANESSAAKTTTPVAINDPESPFGGIF